jgi:hypothetical protein
MHLQILKRCGWTLIGLGIIDLGDVAWHVANRQTYDPISGIVTVIAGVFLVRGGLRTAKRVYWFLLLFLAAFVPAVVMMPFTFPIGFLLAAFRGRHGAVLGDLLIFPVLLWICIQLGRPEVKSAQASHSIAPQNPKGPLILGFAIAGFIILFVGFGFHGETAREARERARFQLGPGYEYVVTGLHTSYYNSPGSFSKRVSATVAAYNATEFKTVQIQWGQ